MNPINFCKFHGFGNDYIIIEADALADVKDIGAFTQKISHRNTGAGSDGIAVIGKSENADYSCRIINPDGSEAGFSGNGTRCAVAYLYYKNYWSDKNLKLETKSGIKNYEFLKREENTFWFLAEIGKPKFELPDTDFWKMSSDYKTTNSGRSLVFPRKGLIINFIFVNVGNPVVCIFVKDFDELDWRDLGREIECFEYGFPERTNVVFVKIINKQNIEIRIWERGAGETSSSGTCSIAAAVASAFTGKTDREVSVHAEGGITEAVWREDDEMLITGRADLVFCGKWFC